MAIKFPGETKNRRYRQALTMHLKWFRFRSATHLAQTIFICAMSNRHLIVMSSRLQFDPRDDI